MRWGRADTRTAHGGASTPQTVRTLQPTTACAASPARVGMLRRAGQRDGMRPCLACARGDATSTPPASTACRAPRLRAWGCCCLPRAAVRCACASPARVGMLLARLFHLLFMAQGPGRHARPWGGRVGPANGPAWGEHDAFPCPAERYHTSGAMLAASAIVDLRGVVCLTPH
jgi:hypothetical protein